MKKALLIAGVVGAVGVGVGVVGGVIGVSPPELHCAKRGHTGVPDGCLRNRGGHVTIEPIGKPFPREEAVGDCEPVACP